MTDMPRINAGRWVAGLLVVVIGAALAFGWLARSPRFTPDGWHYGRMMLVARGTTDADAARQMDAFYKTTNIGTSAKYRALFGPHKPATFRDLQVLFAGRILYPDLAARIEPFVGISALIDVSLAAYVIAGLGVYLCAITFARAWIGILAAILLYIDPFMQLLARSALTDMTAIAIWSLLLAVLCAFPARRPGRLIVLGLFLEVALMLTRPIIYLPAGATFIAAIAARNNPDLRRWMFVAFGGTCAVTAGFIVVGTFVGAPGIQESIAWLYRRSVEQQNTSPTTPLASWYIDSLVRTFKALVPHSVRSVLVLLAATCALALRGGSKLPIFLGAILGGLAAAPLNPDPNDVDRTLIAPLEPVLIAFIALTIARLTENIGRVRANVTLAEGAFQWK